MSFKWVENVSNVQHHAKPAQDLLLIAQAVSITLNFSMENANSSVSQMNIFLFHQWNVLNVNKGAKNAFQVLSASLAKLITL